MSRTTRRCARSTRSCSSRSLDRDLARRPGARRTATATSSARRATGDWAGHDGEIAAWQDGAWAFYAPREGWRCWVDDEERASRLDGSGVGRPRASITALQNLSLLGIGTTADATNPFSAKLNKALWTAKYDAEGGDGTCATR